MEKRNERGGNAAWPRDIPPKGWKDIVAQMRGRLPTVQVKDRKSVV